MHYSVYPSIAMIPCRNLSLTQTAITSCDPMCEAFSANKGWTVLIEKKVLKMISFIQLLTCLVLCHITWVMSNVTFGIIHMGLTLILFLATGFSGLRWITVYQHAPLVLVSKKLALSSIDPSSRLLNMRINSKWTAWLQGILGNLLPGIPMKPLWRYSKLGPCWAWKVKETHSWTSEPSHIDICQSKLYFPYIGVLFNTSFHPYPL